MINYKKPKATLLHASPLSLGEIGGRVCYDSFHMSENAQIKYFKETKELGEDIEESKLVDTLVNVFFHESVIEHINLSYFIENVDRGVVLELNRHRVGIATSQKSSRYTIEKMVNAWIAMRDSCDENGEYGYEEKEFFHKIVGENIVHDDMVMINNTADYISSMLGRYNQDEELKSGLKGGAKKKQNDRVKRCLPESWMLEGVFSFNLRALKHFVKLRGSGSAYYGIQEVCQAIMEQTEHKYRILVDPKYKKAYEKGLKDGE